MSHRTDNDEDLQELMGPAAASAVGWDGSDREPKRLSVARTSVRATSTDSQRELDRIRRRDEGLLKQLLEIRPASEWTRNTPPPKLRRDLFHGFWREGEVAVLLGPPGIGRSILATQIAETIARGGQTVSGKRRRVENASDLSPVTCYPLLARPRGVVYFDFERTPAQFAERYTAIAANGRRAKYRFTKRHQRTFPGSVASLLRGYGYSREEMLVKALASQAATGSFDTMIVEDLTHLCGVHATAADVREVLRKFRRWCSGENSALVIAEADPQDMAFIVQHSPFGPQYLRGHRKPSNKLAAILAESDSAFALCPSTFSPEYRYLKLLKSSSFDQLPLASANGQRGSSPHVSKGITERQSSAEHPSNSIAKAQILDPVHVLKLQRFASPPSLFTLPCSHVTDGPFLGFEYLGLSSKAQHLHDYAADVRKIEQALNKAALKEQRLRQTSAKESLAQGIIDGSYARYMLNE
jgi:hypothetical protein